jgi:meso-butanediol dehydrogenase / (S,S)-butanediol dehydrogenase / diacetyl reductase
VDLEGCRCLVIGGSRHLGRELALSIAAAGGAVIVSSRSVESTPGTVSAVETLGQRAAAVAGDVGTRLDAHHLVRAAAQPFGGLDAVVFSASGPFEPHPPQDVDEQVWDASMDVIARGLLFVAQAARDQFLSQTPRPVTGPAPAGVERGVIVAVTDILAEKPWAAFAAHCAAKAAQVMLVRVLAKAWTAEGVRVCGVAPGPVDIGDDPRREASERAAAHTPLGRLVLPSEVAAAVKLCVSSAAMTGVNVRVDGGALLV